MKKILIWVLMTACCFANAAVPTQSNRMFDVEIIIFKRIISPLKTLEQWPDNMPDIDFRGTLSFADKNTLKARHGITMLPESHMRLQQQWKALQKSSVYVPLLHKMWRQPDLAKHNAPSIRFLVGRNYGKNPIKAKGKISADKPRSGSMAELQGKLKLYIKHYLFFEIESNLYLAGKRQPPKPTGIDALKAPQDLAATELETYLKPFRMQQRRKMRSTEIHYLDHPLMGVIIQVNRAP